MDILLLIVKIAFTQQIWLHEIGTHGHNRARTISTGFCNPLLIIDSLSIMQNEFKV